MSETVPVVIDRNVSEVAAVLRLLGNERRLVVMCRLIEDGEMTAGALAEVAGLSQSAMSQHLARMRDDGLVTFRREAQTIWYRIGDPRLEKLIGTLHALYCGQTGRKTARAR